MKVFAALAGVRCSDCADALVRKLEAREGVHWARVHLATSTLAADFESESGARSKLRAAAQASGVRILEVFATRSSAERAGLAWLEQLEHGMTLRLGAAVFLAGLIWAGGWMDLSPYSLVLLSAVLLIGCGGPAHAAFFHALTHRRAEGAALAALGAWAALAHTVLAAFRPDSMGHANLLSGWLALTMVGSLAASALEARRRRAEAQRSEALMRVLPATARVTDGAKEARRPVHDLRPGDRVRVLAGETVPVDGEVVDGRSSTDESILLGEGSAVSKGPGSSVLAGTRNREAELIVSATRWGEVSLVGTLLESVRDGQSARSEPPPPVDLAAAVAAPVILGLSGAVCAAWLYLDQPASALSATLEFFAFSLPPALLFAGPLARYACLRPKECDEMAAERARDLELIVIGKSTLSGGARPKVSALHVAEDVQEGEVLSWALMAAGVPEHPYAEAVRRYAAEHSARGPAENAGLDYFPGRGVRAVVDNSEVWVGTPDWVKTRGAAPAPWTSASLWVARGGRVIGALEFVNGVRSSASDAVKRLKALGVDVVLASGDAEAKVREAAESAGVATWRSGVSPADEAALVAELRSRGKRVAAVGRCLLEAPVLAQADVGLSIPGGPPADIEIERADAGAVAAAIDDARRVRLAWRWGIAALWTPQAAAAFAAAFGRAPTGAAIAASFVGLALVGAAVAAARRSDCSRLGG